jgi:hypothetical protein
MNTGQIANRNLVSSVFVTLLISLAFEQMIYRVQDVLRTDAFNYQLIFLPATFFFVAVRFFVGDQLHLLGKGLQKLPGLTWLYDLMVIIFECIFLVLLGGLTSVASNRQTPIRFLDILTLLYIIDVLWVVSQWAVGKVVPSWRRQFIPWAWAILNGVLTLFMLALDMIFGNTIYNTIGMSFILGINVLGFIVDMILVDYYQIV